jgi:anti-sigma B factor antagonist
MSRLQYSLSEQGNIAVIKIGGRLDVETSPEFHKRLKELVDKGTKNVVINMGKLIFIASAGLGVLINLNGAIKKNGGKLVLSSMSDKIAKIFKLLGFINLFETYESDQKAIDAF